LDLASLEQGTVLTLVGKVEEVQNPYPELRTTQLAIVRADDFYVWNGFSRADHPTVVDKDNDPAFIQRGKWGWQVKSEQEMQRERRERKNQQNSRY
jgi:starvation-inducible outer membrane lipoprotein